MRVVAVRAARPDCWLGVDANQGYDPIDVPALAKLLATLDVALLEQPVARGREAELEGIDRPLPFAADESCVSLAELDSLVGRFDTVNIKRSEEHTSELQSLMRISYAVFCLKKKKTKN